MKLESQVTSLKLSKRLKTLRVKQESLWYWVDKYGQWVLVSEVYENPEWDFKNKKERKNYSAFTPAELGEKLPGGEMSGTEKTAQNEYICYVGRISSKITGHKEFKDKTEANARAKMLIYLREKGFIDGIKN